MKKNMKMFAQFATIATASVALVGCDAAMIDSLPVDEATKHSVRQAVEAYENGGANLDNVSGLEDLNVSDFPELEGMFNNVDFSNLLSNGSSSGSSSPVSPDFPSDTSDLFDGRQIITVDACDLDGHRESNVAVDVGYGDREYWSFTNDYGQVTDLVADEIVPQYSWEEKSNGRYCWDEAKVPGVESSTLDEGHIIADSLGGVSNAYNITPQNSYLNRYGEQSALERRIRNAGGATDMTVQIEYPNTHTHTPSSYSFTFSLHNGGTESISFDNKG